MKKSRQGSGRSLRFWQESVRAQLASLKYESKANQKAAVKRLLVKWHPDRNLEPWPTRTLGPLTQGCSKRALNELDAVKWLHHEDFF